MSIVQSLSSPSTLSQGGRILVGILFAALGIGAFCATIEPGWLRWTLIAVAATGLIAVIAWRAKATESFDENDIVDIARRAMRSEATRLESKRNDLEKRLMAYGEWMEFPDFNLLQTIDWKDQAHVSMDERISALLEEEADHVLQRYSSGGYWKDGKLEGRQVLLDLVSFVERIARIYRPDSEVPLLELNLESLLKAVNRASLQIILLLEELPILEVQQMNLKKMSDKVRQASKVYRKYEEWQPYLKPVRYLWQGSKLLMTANPVLAAGWIAGSEILWKGGQKLGKKAMAAYLLSLVRQMLGIIAWETAGIYDSTHRYRNPDWIYGVEIAHLLSKFDTTQDVLRETFRELGRLPLKSSFDRIFLYRCIANNVSPQPKHFAQPELLGDETRQQLFDQLIKFYEKNISANADVKNADTIKWRKGLGKRLGIATDSSTD